MSVKQDLVGNPGNQSNAWLAYHVTFHCESVDFFFVRSMLGSSGQNSI